jgi:hypothetical protein
MMSTNSTKRLVQLFERELRDLDLNETETKPTSRKRRVSVELDQQVTEFAAQVRTSGSTPEQMLKELKGLLGHVAPEVPSSQRNAFVATVTGRAIDAFFDGTPESK